MLLKRPLAMLAMLAVTTLLSLTAATSYAGQFGDYEPHGFLSDYSKLQADPKNEDVFVYRQPERAAKYNKLMIDRIKIYLKADAESKQIDPAELQELADYVHDAIVKVVGDAYPVVEQPGDDVLRLRIALTDLVPNEPAASVVTLAVPFLWVGDAGAGVAQGNTGSTPFVGESAIELEAVDSTSSEQIAAYIEARRPLKYNWTSGVQAAATDYLRAYSTWAYTKQAMDNWAKLIRENLDAAHKE